jgi:hypothetical protein
VEVHRETNREFLSPYFRRVAVTLNILELPFELQELFVFMEPDVGRQDARAKRGHDASKSTPFMAERA